MAKKAVLSVQKNTTKPKISEKTVLQIQKTAILDLAKKQETEDKVSATLYNLELLKYNEFVNELCDDMEDELEESGNEYSVLDMIEEESDTMDDSEPEGDVR